MRSVRVEGAQVRPVAVLTHPRLDDGTYLLISACKDGNPMLRSWLGDWIGTFLGEYHIPSIVVSSGNIGVRVGAKTDVRPGHKGAVWSSKISLDTTRAVTGSADFTA